MARRPQKLHNLQAPDEGVVLLPFSFTVNGTSDADGLDGDSLVSATFAEAGEYLCTLRDKYPACFGGFANISNTADDVDLYAKVDTSTVVNGSTFTVRCMTGASQTTPTDNTVVSGVLFVKKSTRGAHRG